MEVDALGEKLRKYREEAMSTTCEGLTALYNRFNDVEEHAPDIAGLRDLHRDVDCAVAKLYGWSDIDLQHGFHSTKYGIRFTISPAARQEVLDRLLELNHERYAEEVALGLHDKGTAKGKSGATGRKGKKAASGSPLLEGA
jgi:hypothetical protein